MERYLQDVVAAKNPPVSQDDPSADQELEDIREQFKVRDLPLKAGPKSKLKAQLKRLQTQEAKIKAGPASKKRAKLQKIYGQPEVVGQRKDDEGQSFNSRPFLRQVSSYSIYLSRKRFRQHSPDAANWRGKKGTAYTWYGGGYSQPGSVPEC